MAKAKAAKESAESKTTTDHEEIRRWVEERGGQPARVKGTNLLRIDYPGYSGEGTLEPIEWDEFFKVFDENNLVFLYQEKTKDGGESRFSKFVDRESVHKGTKKDHQKLNNNHDAFCGPICAFRVPTHQQTSVFAFQRSHQPAPLEASLR